MASAAAATSAVCYKSSQLLPKCSSLKPRPMVALRLHSPKSRLHICCAVAEPQTLETVQKIIASQLSVSESDVKPNSKFTDLGADSLDTVEIMMNLEENFKITLGEEGAEKIATVQDAADMIQEMISKSA